MCGIYAISSSNNHVGYQILEGLKQLEYRGYDSWGMVLSANNPWCYRRLGKLKYAKVPRFPQCTLGLGHTRWATHGGITLANAHPHSDCTKRFYVVHNGIIENFQKLKSSLQAKHHHFKSQTDTEVIAHLMEQLSLNLEPDKAFAKLTLLITGSNAVVILDNQEKVLYAYKTGSPLVIGKTPLSALLSSDMPTLSQQASHVYPLGDGEAVKLTGKIWTFLENKPVKWIPTKSMMSLPTAHRSPLTAPHHMLAEILEQPTVWQRIIDNHHLLKPVAKHLSAHCSLPAANVICTGCGTAGYAAQMLAGLLQPHLQNPVVSIVASEIPFQPLNINHQTLIIALSQSGETLDTLNAAKLVQSKGGKVLSLTNVGLSSLARLANVSLDLSAGPEVAVCATKSFTAMILWSLLLSASLAQSNKNIANQLSKAIKAAQQLIAPTQLKKVKSLAYQIAAREHAFVLGRGLYVPLAYETALKAKEVSYLHFEAFPSGELKHGVIALIEHGTPVILHLPDDDSYHLQLAAAQEVKARGALVIGLGSSPNEVFDHFINIPDVGIATFLLHAVVGQLLGYYLAVARGLDPDMPRNLAKSVTVA